MNRRSALRLLLLPFLALLCAMALAQQGSVELELGVRGAVVANEWNPLRLVVRDLQAVELQVVIDQGSLRGGPVLAEYSASIPAAGGVTVLEDDLYIPAWRSLTWSVRSGDRIIASGSLDPRLVDSRPLILLLTLSPGRWLEALPKDSRVLEIGSLSLPERAAAFAGVEALVVDGSAAAPTPAALAAAASAGAKVILVEPLPNSHRDIVSLASSTPRRIGTGWTASVEADRVASALSELRSLPINDTLAAAIEDEGVPSPALSALLVTAAGATYALLVLLLLRFGGVAGIPAALVVGVLAGAAAWTVLRPQQALIATETTVLVSAGGLGLSLPVVDLRSLPGGLASISASAHPREAMAYRTGPDDTSVLLDRWQKVTMLGRPALASGQLRWVGDELVNEGNSLLSDLLVVDVGPQRSLAPGERLTPVPGEEVLGSGRYLELGEALPSGSVLARDGERIIVVLPQPTGGGT